MRRKHRYILALIVLLLSAGITRQVGLTQSGDSEFFPQTRHTVSGAFLDAYRAVPHPELLFGYPITEAFVGREGIQVQYFQRARFELQPGSGVTRTPLGSLHYQPGRPPAGFNPNPSACRSFETGFSVCTVFLRFYEDRGGEAMFGSPISGVEQDGLRYVQYFEYARLEWHPETSNPALEVQVGPLGRLYFDIVGENAGHLRPVESGAILAVTTLRVHAFTAASAVAAGSQSVFVIVQDQTYTPLPGSTVEVTVTYPSGVVETQAGAVNAHGFLEVVLAIDPARTGTGAALVEVSGASAGLLLSTQTSFRILP